MRGSFDKSWIEPTDFLILGWVAVNVVVFSHVVLFQPPLWVTYLYNIILYGIGGLLAYKYSAIRRLFVLATVAGVVELGADYFLVVIADTLIYPDTLPLIVESPLYMPLAWAIVTTQLGYLALRLFSSGRKLAASLVPAGIAMGILWVYETGAHIAGIWSYTDAPLYMLGNAPIFIIVAEGVMFSTLFYFVRRSNPVLAGVGYGIVITVSYIGAYTVFAFIGL